jgi:hypothetical protein
LLYSYTKHLVALGVGIDNLNIARHSYLQTLFIKPQYEYKHTNSLRSIVNIKLQRKEFKRVQDKGLNSNHYQLSYALQNILSPRSYIQGKLTALEERKRGGTRIDVDYNEYKFDIDYAKKLDERWSTHLYMQIRKREYLQHSILLLSTRNDRGGKVSASLTAQISNNFEAFVDGSYSRVHSNQTLYSYEKYTMSFGINKTF